MHVNKTFGKEGHLSYEYFVIWCNVVIKYLYLNNTPNHESFIMALGTTYELLHYKHYTTRKITSI